MQRKAANDIVAKETESGIYKDEKSYNIPGNSTGISYQRKRLQDAKVWTPDAEKKYQQMKDVMMKMHEILTNVIEATEKLKQEVGV